MKAYTNIHTYMTLMACISVFGLSACGTPKDPAPVITARPASSNSGLLSNCAATPIDYAGKINGVKQKPDYCLQADAYGGCPGFHIGVGDFHAQILPDQSIAIIGNSMFPELQYSTAKVSYQRANEKIWRDVNVLINGLKRKADFTADDLGKNMILENISAKDLVSNSNVSGLNGIQSIMVYVSEFYKESLIPTAALTNNLFTFTAAEAVGDVPNKYNELGFWQLIDADNLRGTCMGQNTALNTSIATSTATSTSNTVRN